MRTLQLINPLKVLQIHKRDNLSCLCVVAGWRSGGTNPNASEARRGLPSGCRPAPDASRPVSDGRVCLPNT